MSNRGIWIIYDMYSDPNKSEEDTSTRKPVNQSWFCYKTAQSSSVRYIDSIYRLQNWQRPPPRIVLTTETDAPHSLRAFICLLYLACRPSSDTFPVRTSPATEIFFVSSTQLGQSAVVAAWNSLSLSISRMVSCTFGCSTVIATFDYSPNF